MTLYELVWPWGALKRAKDDSQYWLDRTVYLDRQWQDCLDFANRAVAQIRALEAELAKAPKRDPKTGRMVKRGK